MMAVAEKTGEKVIVISDLKTALKEFADAYKKAQKGKLEERDTIGVPGIKELKAVLSPKRLELIKAIKEYSPGSIKELAGLVGRDVRNVHRDLSLLNAVGLVELRKEGKEVKPVVDYEEIVIRL